jgi:7-cyano-7-deazaguanine reductase
VARRSVPGAQNRIVLSYPNFQVLSPSSGYPDLGSIEVAYTAAHQLVEQESLDAYMAAFRDVTAYGEDTVNRIFRDLENLIHPIALQVVGEFSSDGDIDLRIVVDSDDNPQQGKIEEIS